MGGGEQWVRAQVRSSSIHVHSTAGVTLSQHRTFRMRAERQLEFSAAANGPRFVAALYASLPISMHQMPAGLAGHVPRRTHRSLCLNRLLFASGIAEGKPLCDAPRPLKTFPLISASACQPSVRQHTKLPLQTTFFNSRTAPSDI